MTHFIDKKHSDARIFSYFHTDKYHTVVIDVNSEIDIVT